MLMSNLRNSVVMVHGPAFANPKYEMRQASDCHLDRRRFAHERTIVFGRVQPAYIWGTFPKCLELCQSGGDTSRDTPRKRKKSWSSDNEIELGS